MASDDDSAFWERTTVNIVINVIRTIIMMLVGILLVPYYIDELGIATYGIIPLATTMTSYIMIISDAMVTACSRYTAVAIQNKDSDAVSKTFNTALFGIAKNILLLVPIIVVFSILSPYIFKIDNNAHLDVQLMFLMILASAAVVTLSSTFNSIFNALNSLYILYIARITYTVSQVGAIFLLFTLTTPTLVNVGIAYLVSSLILLAFVACFSLRSLPNIKMNRADYDGALFRSIASLGVWTLVFRIGTLLFIQASLIVCNLYLGSEASGGFAIVVSLLSMVNSACYSIVAAIFPLVIKNYSEGNIEKLAEMLRVFLKTVMLLFALPVAFVTVFSTELLTTWVGAENTNLCTLVVIAFTAELAFCAMAVMQDVPIAFMKVKQMGKYTVMIGLFNIALASTSTSILKSGTEGIMLCWVLTTILMSIVTLIYNSKLAETKCTTFIIPLIEGYIAFLMLGGALVLISGYVSPACTWPSLIAYGCILMIVYTPLMFIILSRKDREVLYTILPASLKRCVSKLNV